MDQAGEGVTGRIYEYFLSKFASSVDSGAGVSSPPKDLVRMIDNVFKPARVLSLKKLTHEVDAFL